MYSDREMNAMRDTVLQLAEDRGMKNPVVRHRLQMDGSAWMFCLEEMEGDKRDWIIAV